MALLKELQARKNFCDTEWLLTVLAAVAGPNCEVFAPGYEPPKKVRGIPIRKVLIDNSDGFFSSAQTVSKRCLKF